MGFAESLRPCLLQQFQKKIPIATISVSAEQELMQLGSLMLIRCQQLQASLLPCQLNLLNNSLLVLVSCPLAEVVEVLRSIRALLSILEEDYAKDLAFTLVPINHIKSFLVVEMEDIWQLSVSSFLMRCLMRFF